MYFSIPFFIFLWLAIRTIRRFFSGWPTPPNDAAVFITGADTGIGRSTAMLLNQKGFRVFAGVLSEQNGAKLKAEASLPSLFFPVVCDVTNVASVKSAADAVEKNLKNGKLWAVVNNAGVNNASGPVEFLPLDRVRSTFEVNVMGIYHVLQAFLPLVRAAKGRVVNVASVNGFLSWAEHSPYCVSKHAVEALTDGLRMEVEPFGVHVSVIEPGGIRTPIWDASMNLSTQCDKEMGEECRSVYGAINFEKLKRVIAAVQRYNSDPEVVAWSIHDAISSPFPKMRYIVGRGAFALHFLKRWLLPDRLMHFFVRKVFRTVRQLPRRDANAKNE